MTVEVTVFFSSTAERAADGAVTIALFNGDGTAVALLRCSADAALNLIANVAVSLAGHDNSHVGDD